MKSVQKLAGLDGGGQERELKFEVPPIAWDGLAQELSILGAQPLDLHAIYHDVQSHALSRAHCSLRLRSENNQWVQTLKAPGSHALVRIEDEIPLGLAAMDQPMPAIDLERHRSRPARKALRAALGLESGDPWPAVHPIFEVKVRRLAVRVQCGRSTIELALDQGQILASGRIRQISELELELVDGDVSDLLTLAMQWRSRWGLWLNASSKAARGFLLMDGEIYGSAVGAHPPKMNSKSGMGQFTAAVLDACLAQVIANAGEIALGSQGDEQIHQLRVGIRRLRTALRELPSLEKTSKRFEPTLLKVFRELGERRDRTHVLRTIEPMIEAAGGRPLSVPPDFHEGANPVDLVRASDFQDAMLTLLAVCEQQRHEKGRGVRRSIGARLGRLHKQVVHDGKKFTDLQEDSQHRVRKRLKRLRYLSEFAAPLYSGGGVRRYVERIKPAQDSLGQYNDEVMAQQLLEELQPHDPNASFGVQWLQGRRPGEAKACRKSLRKMASGDRFWK